MKIYYTLIFVLICLAGKLHPVEWNKEYKRGIIEITPDAGFATQTAWEEILFNDSHDITVADNGTIFMTNAREHNFYIIGPSGKLRKKVGQPGQGPSDLTYPSDPGVLDNKYLVVKERLTLNRISLFDLKGKFVKILRTQYPPYDIVPLKNNKTAYYYQKPLSPLHSPNIKVRITIYIKDIQTGEEELVDTVTIDNFASSVRIKGSNIFMSRCSIYMVSTCDRKLIVGNSHSNRIDLYSGEGKKIKSIILQINPIPITKNLIAAYEKYRLDKVYKNLPQNQRHRISFFKQLSFKDYYGSGLPLYSHITVDSDGNLLVFQMPVDPKSSYRQIQVYSKEGIFLCETKLNLGKYAGVNKNVIFSRNGIIGIFKMDTDEDTIYKLIRVRRVSKFQ